MERVDLGIDVGRGVVRVEDTSPKERLESSEPEHGPGAKEKVEDLSVSFTRSDVQDGRQYQGNRKERAEDDKDLLVASVGGVDEEDQRQEADASSEFEHPH